MVTFGGVDPSHYYGNIAWIPLSNELYWQITVDRSASTGALSVSSRMFSWSLINSLSAKNDFFSF